MISTKNFFAFLSLLLAGTLMADQLPENATTPIIHLHSAGLQHIVDDTNAPNVNKAFALPETTRLKTNLLEKLAATPGRLFPQLGASTGADSEVLKSILTTAFAHEAVLEITDQSCPGLNLAVRLDSANAKTFSSNVLAYIVKSLHVKVPLQGDSWTAQLSDHNHLRYQRTGEWSVVTIGATTEDAFANSLAKTESLSTSNCWLNGHVDFKKLENRFSVALPLKIAAADVSIKASSNTIQTTVRTAMSESVNWKQQPWHIPTIIHNPLVSFTAVQPLASFCQPNSFFDKIGLNPLARQMFFWANDDLPFQTFLAVASDNATNELRAIGPKLVSKANPVLQQRRSGELVWKETTTEIGWTNIPLMAPYLHPLKDTNDQYLIGGIFRAPNRRVPMPPELVNQLNKPSLVMYDWEFVQNRIGHWDMLTRVLPVFSPESLSSDNKPLRLTRNARLPAHVWMRAIGGLAGNSATEVTIESPQELLLRRKATLGFTGAEIVYLAGWLDEDSFPVLSHVAWPGLNHTRK